MAEYTRTERTPPTVIEYLVSAPAAYVEVEKAIAAAKSELSLAPQPGDLYDDTIMVDIYDSGIVIRFDKPETGQPVRITS